MDEGLANHGGCDKTWRLWVSLELDWCFLIMSYCNLIYVLDLMEMGLWYEIIMNWVIELYSLNDIELNELNFYVIVLNDIWMLIETLFMDLNMYWI